MFSFKSNHTNLKLYITPIAKIALILLFIVLCHPTLKVKAASSEEQYKDGIYRYTITNEDDKEVTLTGIEYNKVMEELIIPGTVTINNELFTVTRIAFNWEYYSNEKYKTFYKNVKKLTILESFTGTLWDPLYSLPSVDTIEFKGDTAPEEVFISTWNRRENLDVLFIVPEGTVEDYENVIEIYMNYYNGSDLYEIEIPMLPTIVTEATDDIEYGCFSIDGIIYQVTSSAKSGNGKVQIVGLTKVLDKSYLALPKEITNNGYTYKLTKLCKFGLVASGASIIVVPDTVTEMESGVFDSRVELLFLSKNSKDIPSWLITNENMESNLRFVYVPEGVTTISENAFNFYSSNLTSVILPTTIKSLGKKSLYGLDLITFLNKKPIKNIAPAIKSGTTVKVAKTSLTNYKSLFNSQIKLIASKNVVKAKKIYLNSTSITLGLNKTKQLTGKLTKSSNETIFWLSSDTKILDVSSKGVITAKKEGTSYVIAYTRTSGLHKAVKVTVTD
jgi:hypothetical protein